MQQMKRAIKERKGTSVFHRYGWTMFFCVACFAFYSHAVHKKSMICADLKSKIQGLELVKHRVSMEREDLALQIRSQSDSEWIEMVLKKRLGVVPEGQMKVYFKKEE